MKKIVAAFLMMIGLTAAAAAQTSVAVSATVTGPNGLAYSLGTYNISLVDAGGNPVQSLPGIAGPLTQQGSLDGNGALSVSLYQNSTITTPPGTQWRFNICSPQPTLMLPLIVTASKCFTLPVTISGAGSITSTLNAAAPSYYLFNSNTGALYSSNASAALPSGSIGQVVVNNGTGSTAYSAINVSKVPVEFQGATPYTSQASAQAGPDDTAKFQLAVNAAVNGTATCQGGIWYHVEGPVNFASSQALTGTAEQTYGPLCGLVSNSASTHILSAVGTSAAYLSGVTWKNLIVRRSIAGTGTSAGFWASFSGGMIVENNNSYDSIYDFYRHASPGFGSGHWTSNVASWSLGENSGSWYGVYDDSADGKSEASVILEHSAVNCVPLGSGATGYGHYIFGTAINDNNTFDFNTAGCSYGQAVNYTGGGGTFASSDIHFSFSTHDGCRINCYLISNVDAASAGSVAIIGGWVNSSVSTLNLIQLSTVNGVLVNGVEIAQHDGFTAHSAMRVDTSSNVVFSNNIMKNAGTYGVIDNQCIGCTFSENTFYAGSATPYTAVFFVEAGAARSTFVGNTIQGYATLGYSFDSSTLNNTVVDPQSIDLTHVTTAISDLGTNNLHPQTGTTGTITGTALTVSCDSGTVTINGAVVGHSVSVSSATGADVGGAFTVRASVTAANTVTVYVCGTGTPASLAYNVIAN